MAGFDPTTYYNADTDYEAPTLYNGFRYPGENNSQWKIELAVDLAANGVGDWFTLDDSTKGVLDNSTYLLAGDVLIDITRWVRALQVSRGRSRRLQKFTAGTCRIDLDNRDRLFDPLMEGSPLFGSIIPRKEVRVTFRNERVFTGNVEDWDFSYDLAGDSIATAICADALSFLARRTFPAATESAETGVQRFDSVLDTVGWPTDARVIVGGTADSSSMAADTHDDVSALQYLQSVELSDLASMYANRGGAMEYRVPLVSPYSPSYELTFGTSGVPFFDIEVTYETDQMTNDVNVTYGTASAVFSDDDATSQEEFGMLSTDYTTLLADATAAEEFAQAHLTAFKDPSYYISRLSVNMLGIPSAEIVDLLALELADPVEVQFRPNNTGEPQEYELVIDGISHEVTPASHIMKFRMSPPIVRTDI